MKRPKFKFVEMGIKLGEIITYIDGKVYAVVVDNNRVELNGKRMSLTEATKIVSGKTHKFKNRENWFHNGESLTIKYNATYR